MADRAYNEITQPFYERLHTFLADQDPLSFTENQLNKYRHDHQIANNGVIVTKELYHEIEIPKLTYFTYLAHYASFYYEALLEGHVTTSHTIFEKALKKSVKGNFTF